MNFSLSKPYKVEDGKADPTASYCAWAHRSDVIGDDLCIQGGVQFGNPFKSPIFIWNCIWSRTFPYRCFLLHLLIVQ